LREYYRGTAEVPFDGSFRVLIPKRLLDHVGVDKDLVFAGQEGKIEIWAKEAYDSKEVPGDDFANKAEDILGGDFGFYNED
jgi:MraZ protein